jgi:hypothetical protein
MWCRIASVCALALIGCASPQQLRSQSEAHLIASRAAQAEGDHARALQEQRKAEYYYDRAAVRAWEQDRPVPPPPPTQPVSPIPVRDVL